MNAAADKLAEVPATVEVHTVTIIANGRHGGFDMVVEGIRWSNEEDFKRTWELH